MNPRGGRRRYRRARTLARALAALLLSCSPGVHADQQADPRKLVAGAIDLMRGQSSYARLRLHVERPDWSRTSTLVAWTRGRDDALIRFTEPARDAGNATLKQDDRMWTFTPKLNRVVRLPYSLMGQSWAGSDFSYKDLSRSDDLLDQYELSLTGVREQDGHQVYAIRAVPYDDAPVVWGREELELRDDYVLLSQTFFDQRQTPLKRLEALQIGELGGRTLAVKMRMTDLEEDRHYTELTYLELAFGVGLDDSLFTTFALRSGRDGPTRAAAADPAGAG